MASTAVIEAIRRTQDDCPSEPADKHLLETNNPTELRGVPGSPGNPGIQGQARGTVAPDPPPEPGFFGANATARAFQCCCPRAAGNGVGERSARSHVYGCKLPTGLSLKLFADHVTGTPIPELAPVTDSRKRFEIPSRSKGGAPRFLRHFLLDDARLGDDDKAESGAAAVGLWAGRRRDSKTIRLT